MVTVTRRLSALEADDDVLPRIVRWLGEAHGYDSLDAYLRVTLDGGPRQMPMDRLGFESKAAAKARGCTDEEIRDAIRNTLFRVLLVLRITEKTAEAMDRESLVHGFLTLAFGCPTDHGSEFSKRKMLPPTALRDLMLDRVCYLLALEEARNRVEERYLGGAAAVWPATTRSWDRLVDDCKATAVLAIRLCELDGLPPIDEPAQLVPTELVSTQPTPSW